MPFKEMGGARVYTIEHDNAPVEIEVKGQKERGIRNFKTEIFVKDKNTKFFIQ